VSIANAATAAFAAAIGIGTCWLIWRLSRPRRGPSTLRQRQLDWEHRQSEPITWRR
jgi:hypothetical protein